MMTIPHLVRPKKSLLVNTTTTTTTTNTTTNNNNNNNDNNNNNNINHNHNNHNHNNNTLFKYVYRIYSINRPGRLLNFWTLRVGAYSRLGAY